MRISYLKNVLLKSSTITPKEFYKPSSEAIFCENKMVCCHISKFRFLNHQKWRLIIKGNSFNGFHLHRWLFIHEEELKAVKNKFTLSCVTKCWKIWATILNAVWARKMYKNKSDYVVRTVSHHYRYLAIHCYNDDQVLVWDHDLKG